jgi:PD-(D/E)XK nuclease superfamily
MSAAVQIPETLRQTLLSQHDKCPHAAWLSMKYPDRQTHEMTRGTALHMVVERGIQLLVENEETTLPGDMATALADELLLEHPEWVLSTAEQDVVRLCSYNWAEAFLFDPETFIGCEIPMQIELCGWTVTGTIDLLEAQGSTFYVRDNKTSLAIKKPDEMRRIFQGQLYTLLAMFGVRSDTGAPLGTGIDHAWFYEEYPRYRNDEGGIIKREADWSRAEIFQFKRSLERNLLAFENSMQTDEWPARDGSWCSMCPAPTECPIPEHLREVPLVETGEQAEEAFSRKLAIERYGRRLQTGMREWVKEHGRIIVGDLAFDARKEDVREVKDWDEMLVALTATSTVGAPFEVTEHIKFRSQTKFAKQKIDPEEG